MHFSICALFVLCCVVPLSASLGQEPASDDEVLARIGPRTITARDLSERITLMPWPGKDNPATQDSAKIWALLSLVAEKLMSMEAADKGFIFKPDNTPQLKALEKVLARDELYRINVLNRVAITSEELEAGLQRYSWQLTVNTYRVSSRERAKELSSTMNTGTLGSSALVATNEDLAHDTLSITFGDLATEYEDAIYTLDTLHGTYAGAPQFGWMVFQLLRKETNPAFARALFDERISAVREKLKKRKESEQHVLYAQKVFASNIRMDSVLFQMLADTLRSWLVVDSSGREKGGFIPLLAGDVTALREKLSSYRERPFITMGQSAVTLEEIVEELNYHPIQFPSLRRRPFYQTLNTTLQEIAEAALASQRAVIEGVHQHAVVQRDLSTWVDAMQSGKLLDYVLDSLAREGDTTVSAVQQEYLSASDRAHISRAINQFIGRLADKYGIEMDIAKTKEVPIVPSNMVTKRLIGFGGVMPARPALLPLWDWIRYWISAKNISP